LPLYRKAGLVHVSLGTEAAAQLNLNVFRKETTIADNKRAVKLLRDNGIVAEVQLHHGTAQRTPPKPSRKPTAWPATGEPT
jgi:anaerobic magnesium-protoporphyrin IX monomethyl ester cyclase